MAISGQRLQQVLSADVAGGMLAAVGLEEVGEAVGGRLTLLLWEEAAVAGVGVGGLAFRREPPRRAAVRLEEVRPHLVGQRIERGDLSVVLQDGGDLGQQARGVVHQRA